MTGMFCVTSTVTLSDTGIQTYPNIYEHSYIVCLDFAVRRRHRQCHTKDIGHLCICI